MIRAKTAYFYQGSGKNYRLSDELAVMMFSAIDKNISDGFGNFMFSPGDAGCLFARQALLRKKLQKGNAADKIRLTAVMTHENCFDNLSEKKRDEYFDLLSRCDECITAGRDKTGGSFTVNNIILKNCQKILYIEQNSDKKQDFFLFKAKNAGKIMENIQTII